jgi:hypothetical protein
MFATFVTRVPRQVQLVEQEVLTILEHPWFLWRSGVRVVGSLVLCVVFCRSLFVLFFLSVVLSVL